MCSDAEVAKPLVTPGGREVMDNPTFMWGIEPQPLEPWKGEVVVIAFF